MAIKKCVDNGKVTYRVRVVKKSAENPGLCVIRTKNGIRDLEEAQRIEKRFIRKTERTLAQREGKGLQWGTLVEEWEQAALKGDIFVRKLKSGTVDDYVCVVKTHTSDWMKDPVTKISKAKAWKLMDQIDREISISRRKRLRTAIDAIFSWGYLSGRIKGEQSIPTEGYQSVVKEEEKIPEILSISEIRHLLKSAKEAHHPWYPIWAMALLTGMRSGELYALKWSKIDFDSNLIYLHENWTNKNGFGATKGRYWRTIPIDGSEISQLLKELKLKTGKTPFVLPRFQDWTDGRQAEILRTFCVGIGIPSVRFHTLRACFGTQLIKDGIAPAVVMKICGWKDLKTMQRYIRLAGIEVKGATKGLKFLPDEEVIGRVVKLFGNK